MTVIIIMVLTMKITKTMMKDDGYCDDSDKNINSDGNC